MNTDIRPDTAGLAAGDLAGGLRLALRRLAKAVVVISAKHKGKRFAMTATAVSELALDPPSMLICVNRSASMHPQLGEGADFSINILHRSQIPIAARCSGAEKGEARFLIGDWEETEAGVPYLKTSQASIICKNDAQLTYGTHTIFIGCVMQVFSTSEVNPLVYADGNYTFLNERIG